MNLRGGEKPDADQPPWWISMNPLRQKGSEMQSEWYKQLLVHTECYDDSCHLLRSPITPENQNSDTRHQIFFHGMGGAPCQLKLVADTLFYKLRNFKVEIYVGGGDLMSPRKGY